MLNHYLKIAWRNIRRSRGFSFLNIAGLAVGMAVALLIGLWMWDEISYDRFHEKYDRTYQMYMTAYMGDGSESFTFSAMPLPVAGALRNDFPEVENVVESDWGWNHSLVKGEKRFFKHGLQVSPEFLNLFSFEMLHGDVETALKDPYSIVLTSSLAEAIFDVKPDRHAELLGETIYLDDRTDVTVTGIVADPPDNVTQQFEYLLPFSQWETWAGWVTESRSNWGNNSFQIYFELKEGVDAEAFAEKVKPLIQQNLEESTNELVLHPMKNWRLYSDWKNGKEAGGYITYVRLFGVIGLFVLLIACINFMNLSTARSEKRAKEVGIRKTVGSARRQLIGQFLGEAMVLVLIAFAVCIGLVEFSLPWFNELTAKELSVPYFNPVFILLTASFIFFTGILAGSYPAFFLSAFRPVGVLKNIQGRAGGNRFRQTLVVTQFTVSVALIIGTIVIWQQVQHAKKRDMGYQPDRLVSVFASVDLVDNYDVLKNELTSAGAIENISRASAPVTSIFANMDNVEWPGKNPNDKFGFACIATAANYTPTIGANIVAGRDFSENIKSDSTAIIFNEAAVERMGMEEPIGKQVQWDGRAYTIVGVMENIVMESPFSPVRPAMFIYEPEWYDQILIRLSPNMDVEKALAQMEPVFEKLNPSYPFEYQFVDEVYDKKFRLISMVGTIATVFGGLAIFISCLGLFGLAAYMAERRTKEIGIRKVLGASVVHIWGMLSKDFLMLVLVSSILAVPLSIYFLNDWLEQYDYRIELNGWVFGAAIFLAIIVTVCTVSFQSVRAALANPVKSLRSE